MSKRKIIGSIIVVVALFLFAFTLGRAFYYSPGSEDVGLAVANLNPSSVINGNPPLNEIDPEDKPAILEIPKIGVKTDVQHVGVTESGLMGVPSNFTDTGWYKYGPVPGQPGSSVIAGHQDNAMGTPAVFFELEKLVVGDDIYITSEDGTKLHFKVRKTETVPYNLSGPKLEEIFQGQGGRYLNLITCAGNWLQSAKTNDLRLIVYTELVE